jgi:hypothetical protein
MKQSILLLAALIAAGSIAVSDNEDWQSLFDGKTLTGWKTSSGQPVTKGWIVEEGCIFRKGGGGDIFAVGEYADFELEFEWKISPKGNSGVKYRFKGGLGPEYQVLDDQGHKNGENPLTSAAALYAVFPCNDQKVLKSVGEFNKARIVATGAKLEHWLNGKKVLEVDTRSSEWAAAKAASKYKGKDGFGEGAGQIMLQDHGNPVWYRNIRIRVLE